MSFKDILGQDRAVVFLKSSIAGGRVAHAYIFFGPEGVGKRSAALNFAKALNCGGKDAPCDPSAGSGSHAELVEACDECVSCRKIDAGNHPDVIVLNLADTGEREKEKTSIGIEEIREAQRRIWLKPYEAHTKVYIIDGAEYLTSQASNALLKTMEEPPPQTVMILLAKSVRELLPTIASRAEHVKFFPLQAGTVKDILTKRHKIDGAKADILSRISCGSAGKALLYDNADFSGQRKEVIEALKKKRFLEMETDGLSKTELKMRLEIMLSWYRDLLVAKAGTEGAPEFINFDERSAIELSARDAEFDMLDDAIKQIISTGEMLDQSANTKLAMAALGLKLN
ncbi:MAG: DNA polymerase III subunit delta' [Candidatus Omnitrophota bacterium]|nr:DNA polymerase III subunit delta' [Candidatus Omnitrophota bacterium]